MQNKITSLYIKNPNGHEMTALDVGTEAAETLVDETADDSIVKRLTFFILKTFGLIAIILTKQHLHLN